MKPVNQLENIEELQGTLRLRLLELYKTANAGHIACSLSCIDILIVLLIGYKKKYDTFILSKGHAAGAIYVCLNCIGEITDAQLETFYKNGTLLPAHPAPHAVTSIPFATGSLGHGLPIGTGIAKANKMKDIDKPVYVLMSDGETNEGTTWEAAHFAVHEQLDNLIAIIDRNGLQGFGSTQDILGDTASPEKWMALGFDVIEANGHDLEQLYFCIDKAGRERSGKPKVIIADTIKGKGVSFMESRMEWHYLPMNDEQYRQAISEITEKYLIGR